MARRPADMTIDQLVEKLRHQNSVQVRSIHVSTPLLLGLHSGETFARRLSQALDGAKVTITHDSNATVYHIVVSGKSQNTPPKDKTSKRKTKKEK